MVYFLQTELPNKKPLGVALQRVFGLGKANTTIVLKTFGLAGNTKFMQLTPALRTKISNFLEHQNIINEDLKQNLALNIENQERLKTYKGVRSRLKLARRGQRTHTNAKTVKKVKKW